MDKSDKQVLTEMLDRAGIEWDPVDEDTVRIEALQGPKNKGYSSFIADFHFAEGTLTEVGIWE